MNEGNSEIYVLDAKSQDRLPINISKDINQNGFPIAWSPDGQYLAFESFQDEDDKLIYVWDGETAINITPNDMRDEAESYWTFWSFDGRLAFTVGFGDSPRSEIYLWDGDATTSLSLNPTGYISFPTWSAEGKLAFQFLSAQDREYNILIWDGISFTNVAPELTAYYSFPTWTNEGLLAFVTTPPEESHAQVVVWDGQTAINISQNPGLHNGSPRWRADGHWAFSTFFSSEQLLYVRDAENRTIFTTEGEYAVWSSDGNLTFCQRSNPGWTLSIWDGHQIIEIAHGYEIRARWQSGSGVLCSSG
jgi:dipeptidyl aminopeptidase/acylaminoacyl peptidase